MSYVFLVKGALVHLCCGKKDTHVHCFGKKHRGIALHIRISYHVDKTNLVRQVPFES